MCGVVFGQGDIWVCGLVFGQGSSLGVWSGVWTRGQCGCEKWCFDKGAVWVCEVVFGQEDNVGVKWCLDN